MRRSVIDYCARCGEDHGEVVFKKFIGNPISCDGEDFYYWGWCPSNLEPLLLFVGDDNEEFTNSRTSEEDIEKSKNCLICGCSSECENSKFSPDEVESLSTD